MGQTAKFSAALTLEDQSGFVQTGDWDTQTKLPFPRENADQT
jgi:hypothetical protein